MTNAIQLDLSDNGRSFGLASPYEVSDIIKASLPERRWLRWRGGPKKRWVTPATTYTYERIQRLANTAQMQLVIEDDAIKYVARCDAELTYTETFATIEDFLPIHHRRTDPWAHQLRAYHWVMAKRASMLYMKMGTGKTKVIVDVACNIPGTGDGQAKIIILCPKSVIRHWSDEFDVHSSQNFVLASLSGGGTTKRKAELLHHTLETSSNVVAVINYESAWRDAMAKLLLGVDWSMVVMDECHRIKAPNGRSSKFCQQLAARATKICGLSGTPMPHSPLDVYAQCRALDNAVFGNSYTRFRARYAVMGGYEVTLKSGKRMPTQVLGYDNMEELNQRLYQLAYHTGDEVLDLPPLREEIRRVDLSKAGAKAYDEMHRHMCLGVQEGEVTAANAMAKTMKLRQLASGFVYDDEKNVHWTDSAKRDALTDLLDELRGEPLVIFCNFTAEIDMVRQVCKEAGLTVAEQSGRSHQWHEWQYKEEGDVLVAQIQSVKEGVQLFRAAYGICVSLTWSLGDYMQMLKRIHRPGQTRSCLILHLSAAGTIDEAMSKGLKRREQVVGHVLDDLRDVRIGQTKPPDQMARRRRSETHTPTTRNRNA